MKTLVSLILSQLLVSCMLSPIQPAGPSRKTHSELSDLNNLEMLLLNDQQSIYESNPELAASDNLRLGMLKSNVERSMGAPTHVEVAGNPKYENERWTYEVSVPTLDGYYKEKKIIYFESGSVVGWESH